LNFLSIIGDYSEDGILTASYGYVGGHEGKSIYNWYIHEVCTLIEVPQNMLNLFYKCNGSIIPLLVSIEWWVNFIYFKF
jgi:hypothetical protein